MLAGVRKKRPEDYPQGTQKSSIQAINEVVRAKHKEKHKGENIRKTTKELRTQRFLYLLGILGLEFNSKINVDEIKSKIIQYHSFLTLAELGRKYP